MKAEAGSFRAALTRLSPDVRLYLLHGPDEAAAQTMVAVLAKALGSEAERVDLDGAALRSDPSRLADEAAALSLFGTARYIRVSGMGDESLDAVTTLLATSRSGSPVIAIAPGLRKGSKLLTLAQSAPGALTLACYVPEGAGADALVRDIGREHGLRMTSGAAHRLAQTSNGDRAVITRELEKVALYLDASPEAPCELDDRVLEEIGAGESEAAVDALLAAIVTGHPDECGAALVGLSETGTSPIPWLRQLQRRLVALADLRRQVDGGTAPNDAVARSGVFYRDRAVMSQALPRWSAGALAGALHRVFDVERALMTSGSAGDVRAAMSALHLARAQGGRR